MKLLRDKVHTYTFKQKRLPTFVGLGGCCASGWSWRHKLLITFGCLLWPDRIKARIRSSFRAGHSIVMFVFGDWCRWVELCEFEDNLIHIVPGRSGIQSEILSQPLLPSLQKKTNSLRNWTGVPCSPHAYGAKTSAFQAAGQPDWLHSAIGYSARSQATQVLRLTARFLVSLSSVATFLSSLSCYIL